MAAMASLGQSSLVGANMSCFVEDVCPSASGIRECRMSVSNGACSSSCSSSFWSSRSGYAADHSWQRSGRPATWRRKREGGGYNAPGQFSGVVRAGLEEGGQMVTPAEPVGAELSKMLLQMQLQLKLATVREDYAEAARLRDMVKALQGEDPVARLTTMMEKAIAEERYTDAARLRDELRRVAPQKIEPVLNCFSDTITKGICVRVRSVYVKDRSRPYSHQYFFAYRIRISNESLESVQLVSRHWIITDADGKVEQARGLGVVGEQPVLLPGTSFEYTSACPLGTSTGRMEGAYQMKYLDQRSVGTFDVKIGPFSLSINGDEWVD